LGNTKKDASTDTGERVREGTKGKKWAFNQAKRTRRPDEQPDGLMAGIQVGSQYMVAKGQDGGKSRRGGSGGGEFRLISPTEGKKFSVPDSRGGREQIDPVDRRHTRSPKQAEKGKPGIAYQKIRSKRSAIEIKKIPQRNYAGRKRTRTVPAAKGHLGCQTLLKTKQIRRKARNREKIENNRNGVTASNENRQTASPLNQREEKGIKKRKKQVGRRQ